MDLLNGWLRTSTDKPEYAFNSDQFDDTTIMPDVRPKRNDLRKLTDADLNTLKITDVVAITRDGRVDANTPIQQIVELYGGPTGKDNIILKNNHGNLIKMRFIDFKNKYSGMLHIVTTASNLKQTLRVGDDVVWKKPSTAKKTVNTQYVPQDIVGTITDIKKSKGTDGKEYQQYYVTWYQPVAYSKTKVKPTMKPVLMNAEELLKMPKYASLIINEEELAFEIEADKKALEKAPKKEFPISKSQLPFVQEAFRYQLGQPLQLPMQAWLTNLLPYFKRTKLDRYNPLGGYIMEDAQEAVGTSVFTFLKKYYNDPKYPKFFKNTKFKQDIVNKGSSLTPEDVRGMRSPLSVIVNDYMGREQQNLNESPQEQFNRAAVPPDEASDEDTKGGSVKKVIKNVTKDPNEDVAGKALETATVGKGAPLRNKVIKIFQDWLKTMDSRNRVKDLVVYFTYLKNESLDETKINMSKAEGEVKPYEHSKGLTEPQLSRLLGMSTSKIDYIIRDTASSMSTHMKKNGIDVKDSDVRSIINSYVLSQAIPYYAKEFKGIDIDPNKPEKIPEDKKAVVKKSNLVEASLINRLAITQLFGKNAHVQQFLEVTKYMPVLTERKDIDPLLVIELEANLESVGKNIEDLNSDEIENIISKITKYL